MKHLIIFQISIILLSFFLTTCEKKKKILILFFLMVENMKENGVTVIRMVKERSFTLG